MLDRMMECSQQQIATLAQHGDGREKLVASRVLESPRSLRHWEGAHSQLLRNVANAWTTEEQIQAIRRMGLAMIHRKAPFEYLRDRHLCGLARRRFFDVVYGRQDFCSSFVREYRNYLEAGASYLCVDRFCAESSMRSLIDYEQRYAIYLRAQFRQLDDEHCASRGPKSAWLVHARYQLQQQRRMLLGSPPSMADTLTLEELYQPTGDTVRITRLGPAVARY